MEGDASVTATSEFNDWELLINSDPEEDKSPTESRSFEEVGAVRLDYFSLDTDVKVNAFSAAGVLGVADVASEGSVESDNPSWVDPEYRVGVKESVYWSDSGSDRSEDRKIGDFDAKSELGFVGDERSEVGFEGNGLGVGEAGKVGIFAVNEATSQVGFEGIGENQMEDLGLVKFWSDSGGNGEVVDEVDSDVSGRPKMLGELDGANASNEEKLSVGGVEAGKPSAEVEKKVVAWWKVPFEVLRYCVLKVGPAWTFSMAAAVVGFVILGRRLYKMKRKSPSLQFKVAVDDKKVSQVMSRAARLNEAFSVVRRVPMVRPLLPAAGVNHVPMMTLR